MSAVVAETLFEGPIAEEYELLRLICPAAADMSRRVGEWVSAWTPPNPGTLDVLEIGCGTGITSLHLLNGRADLRLTGIDNAPAMLAQARRNLAPALAEGRLRLIEADALSHLRGLPSASVDLVASGYALHNFLDSYRDRVLAEIHRVLKPGGAFVNGDRYALDDTREHLRSTQDEVRVYFRTFLELNRPDLLEQWVVHLFSDESPDHIMRLAPALERMEETGFRPVTVHFRDGVNALVSGAKP
ncbi:class I SAM-dependent methyltransferase [Candidatus Methylocalor cossyra]|uniref:Ubiquinone/menaquinone biosynthesis C-methylase UbiE n=1 Tax=Candidatus Methylocalor cossyra TaxID=3108543 RepID=A0ABM9NGI9_9GAMM